MPGSFQQNRGLGRYCPMIGEMQEDMLPHLIIAIGIIASTLAIGYNILHQWWGETDLRLWGMSWWDSWLIGPGSLLTMVSCMIHFGRLPLHGWLYESKNWMVYHQEHRYWVIADKKIKMSKRPYSASLAVSCCSSCLCFACCDLLFIMPCWTKWIK